jgi:hypothetical protein
MGKLTNFMKRFRWPGRPSRQPVRDTRAFPQIFQLGAGIRLSDRRSLPKATPRNLRYFAKTPIARRAINAVKNPIAMLEWEVEPLPGIERNPEIERQIELVKCCLASPNNDDSFRTLVEQVIEDIICGAGAVEMQPSGDPLRPLWMWPVDGLTIQVYPGWSGDPREVRYAQVLGFGTYTGGDQRIDLRNDELIYIRPNPSSATPFGVGALEIAFDTVSRLLATGEFAGNVASNQRPSILIDLGDVTAEEVGGFRAFWQNDVEGQGRVPIVGFPGAPGDPKSRGAGVVRLYPEGDAGLYLKYQEFLIRVTACAFDLSPQNLAVEADVNRNTSEVASDRDWEHAIRPMAALIASHLNREAIHGLLGFSQIEFKFKGIDREDEEATSRILKTYYSINFITPNEGRQKIGLDRLESPWADRLYADVEIAMVAARGVGQIEDPDLDFGNDKPARKPARQIVAPAASKPMPANQRARPKPADAESAE